MLELLCENVNTPLRVYFHSLYSFGIILNFEFHISAKLMFTDIHKRILNPITYLCWSFICETWANLSQLVPKFYSLFVRFNWEFAHWSLRGTEYKFGIALFRILWSQCLPLSRLYMIFSFMTCLNFFCGAWIEHELCFELQSNTKGHSWLH